MHGSKRHTLATCHGTRRWGPYLCERQWGTVREDYSAERRRPGTTFRTTMRARAPIAGARTDLLGICDRQCTLCFALALWNGRDPILKERLFGLTGTEGNHGEDVKEYYFYLDSHSDPFLHEVPVQVSAGARFPTRGWWRRTGGAASAIRSSSWSTPASSTRTAISTCPSNTPRRRRRHPDSRSRATNRGPEPAHSARAADALVPQYVVLGDARAPGAAAQAAICDGRGGALPSRASPLRRTLAAVRRRARIALHRKRNQLPAAVRRAERTPYVKDGIQRLSWFTARATR